MVQNKEIIEAKKISKKIIGKQKIRLDTKRTALSGLYKRYLEVHSSVGLTRKKKGFACTSVYAIQFRTSTRRLSMLSGL